MEAKLTNMNGPPEKDLNLWLIHLFHSYRLWALKALYRKCLIVQWITQCASITEFKSRCKRKKYDFKKRSVRSQNLGAKKFLRVVSQQWCIAWKEVSAKKLAAEDRTSLQKEKLRIKTRSISDFPQILFLCRFTNK